MSETLFGEDPDDTPERRELDRYYTPDPLAQALVTLAPPPDGPITILEPSVGGGAFVRAARAWAPRAFVVGVDADPEARGLPLCHECMVGDWGSEATWSRARDRWRPDLVVGNPPYDVAIDHVRAALQVAPTVCLLLRLAFLESASRFPFWVGEGSRLRSVHVLSSRPSFTGGGTDSAAYGWFTWGAAPAGPPELRIVSVEGPVVRVALDTGRWA